MFCPTCRYADERYWQELAAVRAYAEAAYPESDNPPPLATFTILQRTKEHSRFCLLHFVKSMIGS